MLAVAVLVPDTRSEFHFGERASFLAKHACGMAFNPGMLSQGLTKHIRKKKNAEGLHFLVL